MKIVEARCEICGEQGLGEDGWFVLMENRWTDRLKILVWNEALASAADAHVACGAAHVQQLVVHWMTMGSLEYPFAEAPRNTRITSTERVTKIPRMEADVQATRVVGELAVHRESLERILQESPESLASILEALTSALTGKDHETSGGAEGFEESRELYVLSEA